MIPEDLFLLCDPICIKTLGHFSHHSSNLFCKRQITGEIKQLCICIIYRYPHYRSPPHLTPNYRE